MNIEKVVIIGSGPAGLSAAIYNARALLNPLVIAGSPSGGQLMLTSHIENFPGFKSVPGYQLIYQIKAQAEEYGARFKQNNVAEVDFSANKIKLILDNKEVIETKALIIATGAYALWLPIPSVKKFSGRGVSACATCDAFFFKDKVVAVVGGGDTAMEEATYLTKFASKVYIIHRRNEFRASKVMQKKALDNEKISVIWNAEVEEVLGKDRVEGLKLKKSEFADKDFKLDKDSLKVDGLFMAIGYKPNTSFLEGSGIEFDENGYIKNTLMKLKESAIAGEVNVAGYDPKFLFQTKVKGVFAAGDCIDYTYRQASTAVGMGVSAALEAEKYLEEIK